MKTMSKTEFQKEKAEIEIYCKDCGHYKTANEVECKICLSGSEWIPKLSGAINDLAKEINENAIDKGWYDEERSFGDIIALIHAEASEALEEHRNGHSASEIYFNNEKPEGIPIELADIIIRILDYAAHKSIDIQSAIYMKMDYNKTRPYKHGNKVI